MNPLWTESSISKTGGTFLRCKNCETESRIYRSQHAVLFGCPKCHKVYSKENATYNSLSIKKRNWFAPELPLNSKGELNGMVYTVVGIAMKYEKNKLDAKWVEYVLLEEQTGMYAYLNQSYGHWVFLKECPKPQNFDPKLSTFVNDDSNEYEHFSSYYHVTYNFIGEFPYDVIDVKKTFTREYISPPFIFISEEKENRQSHYQGQYLKPKEVKKMFKAADPFLPYREGIGSCQPFYFGIHPRRFTLLSVMLFLLSLPFYIFLRDEVSNQALASLKTSSIDSSIQHVVTPSFELNERGIFRFDSYSPLDNDWAEAYLTLVNETTGRERSFSAGLEYYHGVDSDGAWHEGHQSQSDYLGNAEPGLYHVEAVFSGSRGANFSNMQVLVYKDSSTPWNYWLCIGSIGGLCALVLFASHQFEKRRYEST